MSDTAKPIAVIGGGISGITAAVELAEVGKEVILIEKEAYLGGNVARMNNYFPKLCPPACGLEINFRRIKQNPRITVYTQTEVVKLEGTKGDYTVSLRQSPAYINDRCTSCGKCAEVCPEERLNRFDYGFSKTKAVYISHEMAFPNKYVIDGAACQFEACGKCLEVCSYNAIDLKAEASELTLEVSAVIIATGWKNYDATGIAGLHYKDFKNVVTNVEFERLLAPSGPGDGKLFRPSDGKPVKEIAFVQCAGSRDENYLPYCSAVCCSASLKHALTVQERYPESRIKIFYIDLRVSGRNEDFLERVKRNPNIELIKGKVAKINEMEGSKNLQVEAEDILVARKISYEAELVVLATGIVPQQPGFELVLNEGGFIAAGQEKGLIPVACSKSPMDVSSSVKDATAAALKAIQKL